MICNHMQVELIGPVANMIMSGWSVVYVVATGYSIFVKKKIQNFNILAKYLKKM